MRWSNLRVFWSLPTSGQFMLKYIFPSVFTRLFCSPQRFYPLIPLFQPPDADRHLPKSNFHLRHDPMIFKYHPSTVQAQHCDCASTYNFDAKTSYCKIWNTMYHNHSLQKPTSFERCETTSKNVWMQKDRKPKSIGRVTSDRLDYPYHPPTPLLDLFTNSANNSNEKIISRYDIRGEPDEKVNCACFVFKKRKKNMTPEWSARSMQSMESVTR